MKRFLDLLGSYGLACVLLFLLFVLTLLGTFEQVDHGLYDVQKKYFESWFLLFDLGPIALPLPGAVSVLAVFAVNMLIGGLIRIRKSWASAGVIVIHLGIFLMLAAALVKMTASDDGRLTLYEGQRSDEYVDYHLWEVAITEASQEENVREWIIPHEDLIDLTDGKVGTFSAEDLPFELKLSHFTRNCRPLPKGPMWEASHEPVEGYALRELPLVNENEQNVAGLIASVYDDHEHDHKGILWGLERYPWTFEAGGKVWTASLRHKRYSMPFTIHLDKFNRELHPGTGIAKSFMSNVTKLEDEAEEKIEIKMNHPLRTGGLVLFQASWGPPDAGPDDPLFSTFAVVRNPSDYWPTASCIVIGIGMLYAFVWKLVAYWRKQQQRLERLEGAQP